MDKEFIGSGFKFWRRLINFWSVIYLLAIIYDFITNNSCGQLLDLLSTVYISALAIYVGNKEFERWYNLHKGKHPGEVFVVLWSLLIVLIIVIDFLWQRSYSLPHSVISSYVAVLTILAITNKSKKLYRRRRSGRGNKKQK